ncbi:uncharacterized protein LOC105258197 [Camponotus floridanus]|uniref:uncharacterized protein LOC105258197 n=1 Tax=Camponotus floridanus TaxID=104421 RepID=UPI000DC6B29A|nr:uncharacterized protein LOC105258197 [Camponotus floridanus]
MHRNALTFFACPPQMLCRTGRRFHGAMRKQCYYSPLQVTHRIYTRVMARRSIQAASKGTRGLKGDAKGANDEKRKGGSGHASRLMLFVTKEIREGKASTRGTWLIKCTC